MAKRGGVLFLFALLLAMTLMIHMVVSTVYERDPTAFTMLDRFAKPAPPQQIHIALASKANTSNTNSLVKLGMTISWATAAPTNSSTVRYGQNPAALATVVYGDMTSEHYEFCGTYSSPWFHHVTIPGSELVEGTTYYYQCGDEVSGWSDVKTFVTALPVGSRASLTFSLIGDLGQTEFSRQTLRHLSSFNYLNAIIHAGDLSYADSEQPRWDSWGKLVEPLASRTPWMIAAGNHEEERPCYAEVDPFVAYQVRFRMPYDRQNRLQHRNHYYAFHIGMVHFIVLTPYVDFHRTSLQYQWLEQELARVDRSMTPWVVAIMHGPWYNSNKAHQKHEPHMKMKTVMEDILFQYRVDLVVSGHVHAYERSYPVYKEKVRADGIIYVVLGDAGNREGLAPTYIDPQPTWSAYRQAKYGFGLLNVLNETHASFEWYENQEVGDAHLRDSVMITSTKFRTMNADNGLAAVWL